MGGWLCAVGVGWRPQRSTDTEHPALASGPLAPPRSPVHCVHRPKFSRLRSMLGLRAAASLRLGPKHLLPFKAGRAPQQPRKAARWEPCAVLWAPLVLCSPLT